MSRGRFIVFEGLDGSGKGTQIELLVSEMKKQGRTVFQTAEPTASSTGGMIRDALSGLVKRDAYELSALFLADRIFHNVNPSGIRHYLDEGIDVVCDRYYYSSFAYQGSEADPDWVMDMNLGCREITRPDLCIFLDVDIDSCDERISRGRLSREIYENKEAQTRIRKKFFDVLEKLGDRENIRIINAARDIPEVAAEILKIYEEIKEK